MQQNTPRSTSIEEATPTPETVTSIEPSPDMSAGSGGVAISANSEILEHKRNVERWTLYFKITSFVAVILLAIAFLLTGLCSAYTAIGHIQHIQTEQMSVIKTKAADSQKVKVASADKGLSVIGKANASEVEENAEDIAEDLIKGTNNEKSALSSQKSDENSDAPSSNSPKKEQPKASEKQNDKTSNTDEAFSLTMVSTGSIITLIAFILGVGLTMILTLLKFTFSPPEEENNNQSPSVTIAGPLSELIRSVSDYLRKKIGLN